MLDIVSKILENGHLAELIAEREKLLKYQNNIGNYEIRKLLNKKIYDIDVSINIEISKIKEEM